MAVESASLDGKNWNPFEVRHYLDCNIPDKSRTLQEIPLLLIRDSDIALSRDQCQQQKYIIEGVQDWLQDAHMDDKRLSIKRYWIPFVEAYFPDTPVGREAFHMAKALGVLPRQSLLIPKNKNQQFWLKTLHYLWQALGVVFAQTVCLKETDDLVIENNAHLKNYLPDETIKNIYLIVNADVAFYRCIQHRFSEIREIISRKNEGFPFDSVFEFFLAIQKDVLKTRWKLEPENTDFNSISQDDQKEILFTKRSLLINSPWLKKTKVEKQHRKPFPELEKEYLQFLKGYGWYGQAILAIRERPDEDFEAYSKALRRAEPAYIDDFQWRKGNPYKYKTTSSLQPVGGMVDMFGYLRWQWA